jgi:hypothetical protein
MMFTSVSMIRFCLGLFVPANIVGYADVLKFTTLLYILLLIYAREFTTYIYRSLKYWFSCYSKYLLYDGLLPFLTGRHIVQLKNYKYDMRQYSQIPYLSKYLSHLPMAEQPDHVFKTKYPSGSLCHEMLTAAWKARLPFIYI